MRISINTDNCDLNNWYLIEESASSEVVLKLEIDQIVSIQSRNEKKNEICKAIHEELSRFSWIVAGSVNVEFVWYLDSIQRQETDKVGDIDNITKPVLDALTGVNGILIDDSQIGSLHTFWQSRNEITASNVLYIKISINNDTCLEKNNLYFIQYSGAVCLPINIDFDNPRSVLSALVVLKARKNHRAAARKIKSLGGNADRFFVNSDWDVHKTRLNGFDKQNILSEQELKKKFCTYGFTWSLLRSLWKTTKKRA